MVLFAMVACSNNTSRCVPGMAIDCPCSGSLHGVQICQADGTFSACECGTTDAGGLDAAAIGDAGSDAGNADDAGSDAGPQPVDAGGDARWVGHLFYAGMTSPTSSNWSSDPLAAGLTSLDAGNHICQAIGIGADHVCDYEELLAADAAAEAAFRAIPIGTTAWLQRTTTADVAGTPSAPGPGGRCNDWTYITNHIADGEYVTFASAGTPTYHLDNDTVFDPSQPGVHTITGDLECGGVMRVILCCYASP